MRSNLLLAGLSVLHLGDLVWVQLSGRVSGPVFSPTLFKKKKSNKF